MRYSISHDKTSVAYRKPVRNHSSSHDFIEWCTNQDKQYHIGWTGVSLVATTAVLFPLTMAFLLLNGASFPLIMSAMISLVLVAVLNLVAMPTRYTIPAFLLGILIDAAVIIISIFY